MKIVHFNVPIGQQIFKAFSDEARIRILHLLYRQKEMCTSDLELILDYTQTKTSRHLSYLKNSGIISLRKIDQYSYYQVKKEFSEIVSQLLTYLEKDITLNKDAETYHILFTNRELAINKLSRKKYLS